MPNEPDSIKNILSSLISESPPASPLRAPLRIHFPGTTLTTPGTHLTRSETSTPPSFSVSAHALDNLSFPNCDLSPTTSAASHESSSTSSILSHSPSAEDNNNNNNNNNVPHYLVAGLDLDPPFPSFPVMGPLLHSLQADMTLATGEMGADEEFIRLQGRSREGEEVAGYMGPAPPPWSGPHRYVFVVWEQPKGVDGGKIREELGLQEGEGVGMVGRLRWDLEGFERRLGLGRVVAGNYFVC
ncbi:phosphatidylethanolamine-binding protein [Cercophora newfieldiana]|uniref:Phosphatidylethanolamine-binding protein n=1 Tax=Cercophora newfieldiana TaxID=92897 RepID=A0AA39Y0L0_9PEZI|nr:phosphatidylethanolamine-binding protein [Cercophora newfieldiana]